jgi:hypothetical protein
VHVAVAYARSPHVQCTPLIDRLNDVPSSSATRGYTYPLTATSEGESYLRLARTTGLLPPADQFMRVTTEDAALDPFQNILSSITRFPSSEFIGRASPLSATTSNAAASSSCTGAHCAGLNFASRTRASFSGTRWASTRPLQERFALSYTFVFYFVSHVSHVLIVFFISWPSHIIRTPKTCTASTRPSSESARGGNFYMRTHGYHAGAPDIRELLE